MIIKNFELKKKISYESKYFLLYGNNLGFIEESIEKDIKPNIKGEIYNYEEKEILNNIENFQEEILTRSFFENEKLIIINRVTDKILPLVIELIEKNISDLTIILKSGILEKKSKLRNFFEKKSETFCVPFYEDNLQTLLLITRNFLKEKKINLSQQNINFIIEKCRGSRISLSNELNKLESFSITRKEIKTNDLIKLINPIENYQVSELVDSSLSRNKKKTLTILNENNFSYEDCIIISRVFLQKLKRLLKIKSEIFLNNMNVENAIATYKPPIFWKEKNIVKEQVKNLSLSKIKELLVKTSKIEYQIKTNPNLSINILTNFILDQSSKTNN